MNQRYEAVVIGGGAVKGIAMLGALHYQCEKNYCDLKEIKIFSGTSVGSIICLLIICGYQPVEILNEILEIDNFISVKDASSIWDIFKFMGVFSINGLISHVEILVKKKLGYIPTMEELHKKFKKVLVVAVSNTTDLRANYYTYKTNPDLLCTDAVKLSCNIPFAFQRLKYNGSFISDGAITDNIPIKYIDDGKIKILAIYDPGISEGVEEKTGIVSYLKTLAFLPIKMNTKLRTIMTGENVKLIQIANFSSISTFNILLTGEQKSDMFVCGYKIAEELDSVVDLFVEDWKDPLHTFE